MSSTDKEAEAVIREYVYLQRYINELSSTMSSIVSELNEIQLAKETISNIDLESNIDVFMSLDRRGYAYISAKLSSNGKVLVNIGSDYYALLDKHDALRILDMRFKDLMEIKNKVEKELITATQRIEEVKKILASLQEKSKK